VELAEEVLHVPVRLGTPQHITGLADVVRNPIYATGVGLLLYGRDNYIRSNRRDLPMVGQLNVRNLFERVKGWFNGEF
jgi:cell division protein FtsA